MGAIYGNLQDFKKLISLIPSNIQDDAKTLMLLETVSRLIDDHTKRHFYVETATRTFRASGEPLLFIDDLLAVTTFKTDTNDDLTFDTTWASSDYVLYPLNDLPKLWVVRQRQSSQAGFYFEVQIVGDWGFGDGKNASPIVDTSADINEASDITAAVTEFDVDGAVKNIKVGQTLLIDSEQMEVTAIETGASGDSILVLVKRGVNGTTAAIHLDDANISVYEYPNPIVTACYMQTARLRVRADAAFGNVVGDPAFGSFSGAFTVHQGLDVDVGRMLEPFANSVRTYS